MTLFYPLTAGLLFAIGLYGLLGRTTLIHRLLGANLMSSAVFLYLVVVATTPDGAPDPVPQAMVLTGIVITVSMTAFALALLRCFRAMTGCRSLEDVDESADDG